MNSCPEMVAVLSVQLTPLRPTYSSPSNLRARHRLCFLPARNQENNGALTAAISALLEEHGGVANNRIYINFFDVPRANCGWSGRTFAG